jgi:hypothetical protein
MVIVESPIFTKTISTILDDEGYRSMQNALVENPALGVVIPHGGGLRKYDGVLKVVESAVEFG